MSSTPKVLGQIAPAANTLTALYTVPALTKATVSSIVICNRSGSQQTFRVSVAVAALVDNVKQYLYYDLPLDNNDTFIATIGATLGAGDIIRVQANTTLMSFTAFGIETT